MSEFIIGIRKHKIIGFIATAYFAEKSNDEFYKITEPVTLSVLEKRQKEFDVNQKRLIKIIENYSGTNLTKIFSKGKSNTRQFLQNIDEETVKSRIRPFVERNLVKIIDILRVSDIKIFHKVDSYNTVYNIDEIKLQKKPAETIFNIIKEQNSTKYFLSARHSGKEINLTNKELIILSNDPCRIILHNDLFSFDDIDAKKLLPFPEKLTLIYQNLSKKNGSKLLLLKQLINML